MFGPSVLLASNRAGANVGMGSKSPDSQKMIAPGGISQRFPGQKPTVKMCGSGRTCLSCTKHHPTYLHAHTVRRPWGAARVHVTCWNAGFTSWECVRIGVVNVRNGTTREHLLSRRERSPRRDPAANRCTARVSDPPVRFCCTVRRSRRSQCFCTSSLANPALRSVPRTTCRSVISPRCALSPADSASVGNFNSSKLLNLRHNKKRK